MRTELGYLKCMFLKSVLHGVSSLADVFAAVTYIQTFKPGHSRDEIELTISPFNILYFANITEASKVTKLKRHLLQLKLNLG